MVLVSNAIIHKTHRQLFDSICWQYGKARRIHGGDPPLNKCVEHTIHGQRNCQHSTKNPVSNKNFKLYL